MSKKLFFLPALLLGAFLMFSPACGDSDPCKDVDCGANGTCFEGECVCNEGFEGAACADTWSAKFVGTTYTGFDNVTESTAGTVLGKYTLSPSASIAANGNTGLKITNFGGFNSIVNATITRANASDAVASKITIDFTDSNGRKFVGSGTFSSNTLSGSYTVTFSDNTYDKATFEYKK